MSKQAVPTYSPSPPRRDARGDDRDRGAANMMQEVQVWVRGWASRDTGAHNRRGTERGECVSVLQFSDWLPACHRLRGGACHLLAARMLVRAARSLQAIRQQSSI